MSKIIVLLVYFSQWWTGFYCISPCFIYIKIILGQNQIFSLHLFAVTFFLGCLLSAINCAMIPCVTSRFCIIYASSLLSLLMDNISASCEVFSFKMFFCAGSHCSSSFLLPGINWFISFEKYNTKKTTHIQHIYTTYIKGYTTTWGSYNKSLQQYDATRKSDGLNISKIYFYKSGGGLLKTYNVSSQ